LLHEPRLGEVADAKADAPDLVAVGRADAPVGRAQAIVAAGLLLEPVEDRVVGHDHVRPVADDEVVRIDPLVGQGIYLLEQHPGVEHGAVADDAQAVGGEDPRRDQVELVRDPIVDHGVAGIVPTLGSG